MPLNVPKLVGSASVRLQVFYPVSHPHTSTYILLSTPPSPSTHPLHLASHTQAMAAAAASTSTTTKPAAQTQRGSSKTPHIQLHHNSIPMPPPPFSGRRAHLHRPAAVPAEQLAYWDVVEYQPNNQAVSKLSAAAAAAGAAAGGGRLRLGLVQQVSELCRGLSLPWGDEPHTAVLHAHTRVYKRGSDVRHTTKCHPPLSRETRLLLKICCCSCCCSACRWSAVMCRCLHS